MFISKFIAALITIVPTIGGYGIGRISMDPQVALKPVADGTASPSVDLVDLHPVDAVETLQGLKALFASENLAVSDQIFATRAKKYIDTAFNNARNLRDVMNTSSDRYRDPGWWALLWTAAYDLTTEQRYIEEAEALLDTMPGRWGSFCGQGSHCRKAHAYVETSLSELGLFLAQLTQRLASGSWFSLDWATHRYDKIAPKTTSAQDKQELKERSMRDCSGRPSSPSEKQFDVVGGIIELSRVNGTMLSEAHAFAGAFLANITEMPSPDLGEFDLAGCEARFKKVFVEKRKKLLQLLPNKKYQKVLERDLDRIAQQARTDVYGSASWVGSCFPLSSASRDWICWALVMR